MAASDVTDGPVLNVINKRLRALRKKYNRITQMEESLSQGKTLNKEQEETLRSKSSVIGAIEELEKLRPLLSSAVAEEVDAAVSRPQKSDDGDRQGDGEVRDGEVRDGEVHDGDAQVDVGSSVIEDLLNLLYFGSMFDVKSQSDFATTVLRKTHERGCCLTYDYVTDDDADAVDLLGETDLDLISMLGGLMISRPVDSSLSHKNALQKCIEHAKHWLANSDQPVGPDSNITYAELRAKLNKIMSSDYFTTTPEMKAPVEVAAAAENYKSFQVPVQGSVVPVSVPVEVEGVPVQYEQKEEELEHSQGHEVYDDQSSPVEELHQNVSEVENASEFPVEIDPDVPQAEEQNFRDVDAKEQQHVPRRYQNYRGGRGGGRRGYPNGRGSRGSGRGGGYQNGGNQYYEQGGNYYRRNNYNYRGRGGRGGPGGNYNQSAPPAVRVPANS